MKSKKQILNQNRFKRVMAEAKKLRLKRKSLTQAEAVKQAWQNIGAIKIIEKGESKNTKPKATYQYKRSGKGTFKGLKRVGASASHKDTRSHNVNIRVVSGYKKPMYAMGNVDMKKLITQFGKESKLKKDVVTILLRDVKDYDNNYKSLFKDILYNGLQSGIVGELIYYSDTTKWYKKHKKDIISLLKESMANYGTNTPKDLFGNKWDSDDYLIEDTQNQNLLAWFSFEETTRELADRMGIEI